MFDNNDEIIKQLRKENKKFRDYEKDHERLSRQLDELNKRKTLLPVEELTVKKLHKEKLVIKDTLVELIRQFKGSKVHS